MGAVAVLALLAGIATSIQVAVLARLGTRIGLLGTIAFSSSTSALLALTILLVVHRGLGRIGDALRQPPWLWLGGVLGIGVLLVITFAGARLGTAATVSLLIAGQLAMGVVIDRFGLFGGERIALNWPRAVGVVLLGAGAALSLRR